MGKSYISDMMSIYNNNGMVSQQGNIAPLMLIKIAMIAVLLAWLALSSIQIFNLVFTQPDTSLVADASSKGQDSHNKNRASDRLKVNLPALLAEPLFDEVVNVEPQESVEPPKQEEVLVETKLNLTLKGLLSALKPEQGQAIIANGKKEDLYEAGDEIEGLSNVKLLAVYEDRVTLDNRGVSEVLYLYAPGERLQSSVVDTSPDGHASVVPEIVSAISENHSEAEQHESAPNAVGSKNKKLNEIMRVVRERDKTTGEMLGFRVLPGRDRESFEHSGLKVNDVITAIDGNQLTDLRTAMTIYRKKRDASQVSLIVQRDGSEISLDIDLTILNIN